MTARLPSPGSDDGTWGQILNTFLGVSHNSDGTLITSAMNSAGAITTAGGLAVTGTPSSSNFLRGDGTWSTPAGGGSATLASDTDVTITTPSNNQVLTYNSGTSKWINQSALVTSAFGRTGAITATSGDYTFSQVGAAQGFTPTSVKTSAYTAAAGDFVPVDASSGTVVITLPTTPADKSRIEVKLINTSGSNTVTINTGGSDVFNKTSGSTSATLSLLNQAAMLQYTASTGIWYVQSDDLPLTQLDSRYAAKSGTTFSGALIMQPVNLTDGATISTNAALGNHFRVTLAGNRTLANPTGAADGQLLTFSITQDATGSRTITLGSAFHFGTDITSITLSTTANVTDKLGVQYNQSTGNFDVIAFVRGF
jgi:hypothetical protein